jgi:hypothetical protein
MHTRQSCNVFLLGDLVFDRHEDVREVPAKQVALVYDEKELAGISPLEAARGSHGQQYRPVFGIPFQAERRLELRRFVLGKHVVVDGVVELCRIDFS